jgi:3,4-dihydroxy 2-butanone 4-phosphate synthase/GTP cyclohydrolase II
MPRHFCTVEQGIQALSAGRVVIVLDSEDRENEGDFLALAETITPATIHFMAQRGCGQLCVPVAAEIARRLQLQPMPANHADPEGTAFAVPVDHVECKTGISPVERVRTIRALLEPTTGPADFIRPGHVFPLIARDGGVLRRAGHTEAAVDLARLAGMAPAGVLCEICSRDGRHMADQAELLEIADEFDLPLLTIDDLIRYRQIHRDDKPAPRTRARSVTR